MLDEISEYYKIIDSFLNEIEKKLHEIIYNSTQSDLKINLNEIYKLNYIKNRYIFELYKNKKITLKLIKYLKNKRIINIDLFNYWKIETYQNLCCLNCIKNNKKLECSCRIKSKEFYNEKVLGCDNCGCKGCK